MDKEITRVSRTHKQARHAYDEMSRWYDIIAGPSESQFSLRVIDLLDIQAGENVIEIGCGTGNSLVQVQRQVGLTGLVNGVDISLGMCRKTLIRLKKYPGSDSSIQCADATAMPLTSGSFVVLLMTFVLELFDTPEIPIVLNECERILKPGGRIGIVSLSKTGNQRWLVNLYEKLHNRYPLTIDCRPIYLENSMIRSGFSVHHSEQKKMWGLPVEIVIATKREMYK